ncbi:MAG: hypothetical protein IH987_11580 [Planctomycetes bacterium]|nr:hypothetical protein [Planctomycetota bacterium]
MITDEAFFSNDDLKLALIEATCKIASNLRGGGVFSADEFLKRVIDVSVDTEAEWWRIQASGSVAAMFRQYQEIERELKGRHVLAWVGDDGAVRVVNSEFVNTRAEICDFVTSEPQPGNMTCRFCTVTEEPDSRELLEVNGVRLHQRCRQFWDKWQRMSQKEAGA